MEPLDGWLAFNLGDNCWWVIDLAAAGRATGNLRAYVIPGFLKEGMIT